MTGNVAAGIVSSAARPSKLKISTATGTALAATSRPPIAPKLVASTCDHSVDTASGGTLHVCTGD